MASSASLTAAQSHLSARSSLRMNGLKATRCVRGALRRQTGTLARWCSDEVPPFLASADPPRSTCLGNRGSPRAVVRARSAAVCMAAKYDYDLVIVGCGVGGHGAALHAVESGLKVAVLDGNDVGGTCVNRGCVPSKALLAASGRIRDMRDAHHLKQLGITARHTGMRMLSSARPP